MMDIGTDYCSKVNQEEKTSTSSNNFRNNTLLYKLRRHFRSYCNHTSIHGFQYLGQNRTVLEKIWWITIFIGIISCCGFAICLIYNKWRISPVIVSLTTRDTPIYQVPFPAVTICPTIKFMKEKVNFSSFLKDMIEDELYRNDSNSNGEEEDLFEYMLPLCKVGSVMRFNDFAQEKATTSNKVYDAFLENSPFLKNGLNSANFMDEPIDFDENFRPILTEDGLCFSFNMLSTKDVFTEKVYVHPGYNSSGPESHWIPQHGYSHKAGLLTYPRRAALSGVANSLQITIFHQKKDIDVQCTGAEQGYKVILHLATRVPRPALEYKLAPFGKATMISVNPHMMSTSDVVKDYPPDKRDCFFDGEKKLKFFKIYSKTNCDFECITNYTLKECGCVPFNMPGEASTPICGISKLKCIETARKKYNLAKLESRINELQTAEGSRTIPLSRKQSTIKSTTKKSRQERSKDTFEEDKSDNNARCYCLRPCTDLTYASTSTSVDYNWQEELFLDDAKNVTDLMGFTLITIFLDTNYIFTTERNELYGPMDFLSNFGGLLGLFTGFSILSLMEILYFCSLRILGNRKLLGRWYGDKDGE